MGRYPGVEIHANVIDNILTDSYFQITYANNFLTAVLMLLLGLVLGPILIHLKPLHGALATLVLIVLYTIVHRWMVVSLLTWTSYLFVVIDLMAVGAVLTLVRGHYLSGKAAA